ncbi:MAG: hypothetical protein LBK53_01485 [Heliobacteriaceae bacterium]|jgi:hypothetical protein|nr:hypothetical protein [Heliobacteriaceae bacterium]
MKCAVLFLIFNRLDKAKAVFAEIKKAKPPKLYIASDGARANIKGEKEAVENIRRQVLDNIDWGCDVKTLFRNENLGCGIAVSEAVTWFFEHEEQGIILEDDCVPSQTFFTFCDELLDKYKDNKEIWTIAGANPAGETESKYSYIFSKIFAGWGWAAWADRWQHYSYNLTGYDESFIDEFSSKPHIRKFYKKKFQAFNYPGHFNNWDWQAQFMVMRSKGLNIHPVKNLVTNIGEDGYHCQRSKNHPLLNKKHYDLETVIHPPQVICDDKYTDFLIKLHCGSGNRLLKFLCWFIPGKSLRYKLRRAG